MLSKKALKELIETTHRYPGGFVVLEENLPKFVILDYENYRQLMRKKLSAKIQHLNILVTGGAGYIGSHTARLLVGAGHNVVTLDNLSTGFEEFVQGKFVKGDLSDVDFLDKFFTEEKFDAVIHFAACLSVPESVANPEKYYTNNLVNSLNLLNAMKMHKVDKIIFSSTCAVYSDRASAPMNEETAIEPASPYGESKAIFEKVLGDYANAFGIKSVSLRYFNAAGSSFDGILGPANPESSSLIPNVLNVALGKKDYLEVYGKDYNTSDGTGVRDYVHVLDLANAHILALDYLNEKTGSVAEIFNIGTGKGYSVLEVINQACDTTGKMIKFEVRDRRAGDPAEVYADTSKAEKVLGFHAEHSDLKTILDTHWAFHKKRFG